MPFYDYSCTKCGAKLEVFHRINEPGPKRCRACGCKVERDFSRAPAVHCFYSPCHPRFRRGMKKR